ncbi:MAG: esterase [Acidimicrobiales bacterium]|nr:esterase [Acidimicrobiales bacterium]
MWRVAAVGGWGFLHSIERLNILHPAFMVVLVVLSLTAIVVAWRAWLRGLGRGLLGSTGAIAFCVLTVAAGVNQHYGYLPMLGSLWGWRAADQASWSDARRTAAESLARERQLRSGRGKVVLVRIPGEKSGFKARKAQIYLPPAWFRTPRPRLPVLVLLHGTPGTPLDWTRSASADLVADRFARSHSGRAPILVMPDSNGSFFADTECVDGVAGNAETYLVDDVPHWVVAHMGTAAGPARWGISGASAGGTCALHLALRHPDRFGTLLDFSGEAVPTRHGDPLKPYKGTQAERRRGRRAHDPNLLITSFVRPERLSIWFGVGRNDGKTTEVAQLLAAKARDRGFRTVLDRVPGGHKWSVWRLCFERALPWASEQLGLDEVPP